MNELKHTKSKEFFIGRDAELETFRNILEGNDNAWIVHVPGDGGIGKTKLLEQFAEISAKYDNLLATPNLVDFYKTHNQTISGILLEITTQLGAEYFPNFTREYADYRSLAGLKFGSTEDQLAQERLSKEFFIDYADLLANGFKVVLLFDTYEEMHGALPYIMDNFLPEIQKAEQHIAERHADELDSQDTDSIGFLSTVVLAGRKPLEFDESFKDAVVQMRLPSFTLDEAKQLFEHGELDVEQFGIEEFEKLYEKTGGRPLFVVLSYDWLKYGLGTIKELVNTTEPFGKTLIQWIDRLDDDLRQAILFAALVWRRMESSLLAHLLQPDEEHADEESAESVIQKLLPFSFIKYRSPESDLDFPGTFQLHDEMRRLVVEFKLAKEGRLTQKELLAQIIEWYKKRINDPLVIQGKKSSTSDRQRELLAELLYYECELDLDKAFELYETLYRYASHHRDLQTCSLLNEEAERFITRLPNNLKDDHRFRQALTAFYREDYERAEKIWYSLDRTPDAAKKVRATTKMMLMEVLGYTGDEQEALKLAGESEALYDEILAGDLDPDTRTGIEREVGQLYNNWGYIYRVLGDFDRALKFYYDALERTDDDKYPKNYARTLNNAGYVYFLKGDFRKAKTYTGRSLQMRKVLDVPYELGLSYNTMGMILYSSDRIGHAIDQYDKAFISFQSVRSDFGMGLVRLNRGRIYRITNSFEQALAELEPAYDTFKKLENNDNLIQVGNELGCLFRDKTEKEEGDWERAEEYFKESLALSRELGQHSSEADNWEDLSILYEQWAEEMRKEGNEEEASKLIKKARTAIAQVNNLAGDSGESYLQAKAESTLGNLAYDSEAYAEAFSHYLIACRLMAEAIAGEKELKMQPLRRYQEMTDRLQEQLHALPTAAETIQYGEGIIAQIELMKKKEQERLNEVKELVEASVELASTSSSLNK